MKMRAGAVGWGNGAYAQAQITKQNTEGGYIIAGAAGTDGAAVYADTRGGNAEFVGGTFELADGRQVAIGVLIGTDDRRQVGPSSTTGLARAGYTRKG